MSLLKKPWSILLYLILVVSINSCQKDLLTEVDPENISETPPGLSTISFEELQKRIKITKSGIYSSVLANGNANGGKFQLRDDIILLTNKVTMISGNGMTTYTLAVEQKSGQRATFQNVIFVDRKGVVETHLLTYKASKFFASKLKVDKNAGFEGYISYSILENKKQKGTMSTVSAETCVDYAFQYSQPYHCAYPEKHMPWQEDECIGKGTSNGPGYETVTKTARVCTRTGSETGTYVSTSTTSGSGGGGSTGSVVTYPTLPLNYNPNCEYGYAGVSQVKSSGMSTSGVGDGDCPYDDPNPAGLIANINKLTGLLGLSWAKQEFLHTRDALQGQSFTLDF